MELEYRLPYFIEYVEDSESFIKLQLELFDKGYKWIDGSKVYEPSINFLKYPLYLSNLPFIDHSRKDDVRKSFNEYRNDILFFDDNLPHDFDMKVLRKYKLKKISEYDV